MTRIKLCAHKGFALNHDKSLQINFICVKHQTKNDFLKDVESTVGMVFRHFILYIYFILTVYKYFIYFCQFLSILTVFCPDF